MARFDIHRETPPTRCEICHQSDCFDAAHNHCTRCAGVVRLRPEVFRHSRATAERQPEIPMPAAVGYDPASLQEARPPVFSVPTNDFSRRTDRKWVAQGHVLFSRADRELFFWFLAFLVYILIQVVFL